MSATPIGAAAAPMVDHNALANALRVLAIDAVERAASGHPGMPMGMADVATVLFTKHLKYDADHPEWPDRDRFVLSAGHGSMLLYALLHLTGYPGVTIDELKRFRQFGAKTAGHPEYGHCPGVETTTGPLGQGLANAVGMALAERILNARFGDGLVDHRTYVIAGDGCLMEGISHEAISLAGHLRLSKLIVLWDDNRISIDGPTDLAVSDDQIARFKAHGWATLSCDGHDSAAIDAALVEAKRSDRPVLIACRTIIGKGSPKKAGTAGVHGSPLGAAEAEAARAALGWTLPPFEVPEPIRSSWRAAGLAGRADFESWTRRLDATEAAVLKAYEDAVAGRLPDGFVSVIEALKARFMAETPKIATRQASGLVLEAIVPAVPELVGGSADLTGSNNTRVKTGEIIQAGRFDGRYIHYGVREHAMAAAMNGMALHGGIIPYGGTFLVFSDYCRPALRLAALMQQRVVHVMTHDSIGLGEDGPTHQPIEHLAALRAIPGLYVFRPADPVETAEAWLLALCMPAPSVIALTRQALPTLRMAEMTGNQSARGGYVLREASSTPRVSLIATGSEVQIACAARDLLEAAGVPTRVVSLPCTKLFDDQDAAYRETVLGRDTLKISIEAGSTFGWARYVGDAGLSIGIDEFGASAPYEELYRHFGLTPEAVVEAARARL